MSVFKAQATMRELKQRLQLQMPSAVMTDAQDANGYPAISILYNSNTALAKIAQDGNAGRVDGLGLSQRSYSPHIAELLQNNDLVTVASAELKARMHASMGKLGMKLIIKADSDANVVAAGAAGFDAAFTAAPDAVATLRSDEINPLTQSQ